MLETLFTLFLFVSAVLAQDIYIGLPTPNQAVVAGNNLTVQILLSDALLAYDPVAIVLGLQSCLNSACSSPSTDMGNILYNGLFQPELHEPYSGPYENFTVQVPSSTPTGTASLGVAYFLLIGIEFIPTVEVLNQTITIVA